MAMVDQARSEGARYERAAIRTRLRRRIKDENSIANIATALLLKKELDWVLDRQRRYDKAPGGLGRTITAKKDTKIRRR